MKIKQYVLDAKTQPIQLERGEVECWILSISKGSVDICVDDCQYQAVEGEVVVVEPYPGGITVKPCKVGVVFVVVPTLRERLKKKWA